MKRACSNQDTNSHENKQMRVTYGLFKTNYLRIKKYLLVLIALLLIFGCENRSFEFVATIDLNETYLVDQTGAFNEAGIVTRNEVLDMIDIPETAEITDVNLESVEVKIVVLESNEAMGVLLSGSVELGSSKPALFNNFPVPLVAVNAPFIGINSLISEGVAGIRSKIEKYLEGSDTEPFEIHVSGDSSPSEGERIHVQILLKIKGTVKYNECMEVPYFMEGGDPC